MRLSIPRLAIVTSILALLSACGGTPPSDDPVSKVQGAVTLSVAAPADYTPPSGSLCFLAEFAVNAKNGAKTSASFPASRTGTNALEVSVPAGNVTGTLTLYDGSQAGNTCTGLPAYSANASFFMPPGGTVSLSVALTALSGTGNIAISYDGLGCPADQWDPVAQQCASGSMGSGGSAAGGATGGAAGSAGTGNGGDSAGSGGSAGMAGPCTTCTAVSGIISADTTWSLANSPYTMTGEVQLAGGKTLTIEPGVQVFGNNQKLATWGALSAIGTPDSRIELDDVILATGGVGSEPTETTIQYALINRGSIWGVHTFLGAGGLILRDSVVRDLIDQIYLQNPQADCHLDRNVFIRSPGIVTYDNDSASIYVTNNSFSAWTAAGDGLFAIENLLSVGPSQTVLMNNSFLTTTQVAVRLPPLYANANLSATNNYWGTTDLATINAMIYDQNDDLSSAGVIPYLPILDAPDPATPDPQPWL